MSRHTYLDGITPRPELDEMCDEHYSELGPSPRLTGKWIREEISWNYYVIEYENEMRSIESMKVIKKIIRSVIKENVTVMCIEESSENCHRGVFLKICKGIISRLGVIDK